jgi:hypothetical protein
MEIIKKIGKYLLLIIIFLVGIFLTITVLSAVVIILSKVFANLWGLNSPVQALIALLLTAIIIGLIYKPYKKLVGKADLLIEWASN